jgi:hypothetical protein
MMRLLNALVSVDFDLFCSSISKEEAPPKANQSGEVRSGK